MRIEEVEPKEKRLLFGPAAFQPGDGLVGRLICLDLPKHEHLLLRAPGEIVVVGIEALVEAELFIEHE